MRAAELFCGIEQMAPRVNPGGKMVTPGMASAKAKSLDNDDERVNSCSACDARQVTLDGKMLSIVTVPMPQCGGNKPRVVCPLVTAL